jgi:hypothetical protein
MKLFSSSKPKNQIRGVLRDLVQTKGSKIKADAKADGQYLALKRPSLPLLKGDSLIHYISPIKARCEQVAMEVLHTCQPASHLPHERIDTDWAQMHNQQLQEELDIIKNKLEMIPRELGSFNPATLSNRIRNSILVGIALLIGEVVLNTQAFQVTGDNLLSCLILSLAASGAVCLGAHFAGRKYKDATTRRERWVVVLVSLVGMGIFSAVIATLRSLYFKRSGIDINPILFTVFNMIFFLIAAIATWYNYPTKDELETNRDNLQKHKEMKKLTKQKKIKEQEIMEHGKQTKEQVKENIQAQLEAEYAVGLVRTLYKESIGEWRMGNIMSRTGVPDCWNDPIPELDIPLITFQSTINKYKEFNDKPQSHENRNTNYLT